MEQGCCKVRTSPAESDLRIILDTHWVWINSFVAEKKG